DVLRLRIPRRSRSDELGLEQEAIANLAEEDDDDDEGDGEPEQSHRARLADLLAPVEHLGLAPARVVRICSLGEQNPDQARNLQAAAARLSRRSSTTTESEAAHATQVPGSGRHNDMSGLRP